LSYIESNFLAKFVMNFVEINMVSLKQYQIRLPLLKWYFYFIWMKIV